MMMNRFSRREFLKLGSFCALPVSPLLAAAADPATLKIRSVEAHVLKIGRRSDIVCARIETAEGIHGWGEGTTSRSSGGACTSWKRTRWAAPFSRG